MSNVASTGLLWVGLGQAARTAAAITSAVVVGRILSPAEYGVVAMAAPVTAFLLLFQDLGFHQAIIQRRDLDISAVNSLFWINVGISALIALGLVILSPLIGWFYGDIRPGLITAATAITVVVTCFSLQHAALLARDLQFRSVGIVDCISALAGLAATIVAALVLRTYWALWVGTFISALSQTITIWCFSAWRPTLKPRFGGARELMRFGAGVTGFNVVNFLVRNLDNILIAKAAGPASLGFYDQSYKLMMAPMQAVSGPLARVIIPILSRLQDDPGEYRQMFLSVLRLLLLVLTPALAGIAALSWELLPIILGEKWRPAAPIFFWLSLTGLIQPIGNATGWLFLTSGRSGAMFKWGILSAVITCAGFLIGLQWGAIGVAASLFWTMLLRMPVLFPWCVEGTSVRARDLYRVSMEPVGAALSVFVFSKLISLYVDVIPNLILSIAMGYLVCISLNSLSVEGRASLRGAVMSLKRLVSGRRDSPVN